MDRYSNYSRAPYTATVANRSQRSIRAASYKESGLHDEMGSLSGSEDGNYTLLHEVVKQEVDERQYTFYVVALCQTDANCSLRRRRSGPFLDVPNAECRWNTEAANERVHDFRSQTTAAGLGAKSGHANWRN